VGQFVNQESKKSSQVFFLSTNTCHFRIPCHIS